jgi:ribose-phosphate pyrophosphokinase
MIEIFYSKSLENDYKLIKFPGGELQPRISGKIEPHADVTIVAKLYSSDDIMELMLVVDALRRKVKHPTIHFVCPYLPYARQDRVCFDGESLSLKVMCDMINSLKFETVTVWDVHSDVSLALLNNVHNVHQKEFVAQIPHKYDKTVLVIPDAGAMKKTFETAKYLHLDTVRADKIRSVDDGSITGTVVYSEHLGDKDFLIVDDICDGGRTFTELAKVLRELTTGKIELYVTHGIFSQGLDVFKGLIDHIYVANPFPKVDLTNPLLTLLEAR